MAPCFWEAGVHALLISGVGGDIENIQFNFIYYFPVFIIWGLDPSDRFDGDP